MTLKKGDTIPLSATFFRLIDGKSVEVKAEEIFKGKKVVAYIV